MEWYQFLIFIAFMIALTLLIPKLRQYRAWQFFGLILGGFLVGYLLSEGQHMHPEKPLYGYGVYILLLVGLVYQAIKFYRTIK